MTERHIGVTGTESGGNTRQLALAEMFLGELLSQGFTHLHHGDCVGVDDEVALIAADLGYTLVGHPPTNPRMRAFNKRTSIWMPERPYLDRNQDIVDASEKLLAVPKEMVEILRSGTWSTVRRARKKGLVPYIIYPE
jgi:hypothetical protein